MADWYALYAKPHKEQQLSSVLESEGYEVYLPTITVKRRGREKSLPFFPCYLFARLDGHPALAAIRWTPGLRRVVSFGGKPAAVPDEVITLTKERLAWMDDSRKSAWPFEPGDKVRINSGPLVDFEAVFQDRLTSQDRARILVECLGRWTRCEVGLDSLTKK